MKALLLTGLAAAGLLLTGCETTEVSHGRGYRSGGYYDDRPGYSRYDDGYYGSGHRRRDVVHTNVHERDVYQTNVHRTNVNRVDVNRRTVNRVNVNQVNVNRASRPSSNASQSKVTVVKKQTSDEVRKKKKNHNDDQD